MWLWQYMGSLLGRFSNQPGELVGLALWCWQVPWVLLVVVCETHQLTVFHGSLLHLLPNSKLWRSKLIKCLQGLCKSWLCNRTQCITAGGKRSSSCYKGTKIPCVKYLLFVLILLGLWRAVVFAAWDQPFSL